MAEDAPPSLSQGQMMEKIMRERYEKDKKLDDELNMIPLFMTDTPRCGPCFLPADLCVFGLTHPCPWMPHVFSQESDAYKSLKAIMEETPVAQRAQTYKESGNEALKLGRREDAIAYYSQAIELQPDDAALLSVLFANRAQAQLSLGNHGRALADSQAALDAQPNNIKVCVAHTLLQVDCVVCSIARPSPLRLVHLRLRVSCHHCPTPIAGPLPRCHGRLGPEKARRRQSAVPAGVGVRPQAHRPEPLVRGDPCRAATRDCGATR